MKKLFAFLQGKENVVLWNFSLCGAAPCGMSRYCIDFANYSCTNSSISLSLSLSLSLPLPLLRPPAAGGVSGCRGLRRLQRPARRHPAHHVVNAGRGQRRGGLHQPDRHRPPVGVSSMTLITSHLNSFMSYCLDEDINASVILFVLILHTHKWGHSNLEWLITLTPLHLHLHLGNLANAFIQGDLQRAHLIE